MELPHEPSRRGRPPKQRPANQYAEIAEGAKELAALLNALDMGEHVKINRLLNGNHDITVADALIMLKHLHGVMVQIQ